MVGVVIEFFRTSKACRFACRFACRWIHFELRKISKNCFTYGVGFDVRVLHKDFPGIDEIAVGINDIHFPTLEIFWASKWRAFEVWRRKIHGFDDARFVIGDGVGVVGPHDPKTHRGPMRRKGGGVESDKVGLELVALFVKFRIGESRVNIDGDDGSFGVLLQEVLESRDTSLIIFLCFFFVDVAMIEETVVCVRVAVFDGQWFGDMNLGVEDGVFLVIVVSVNGFATNMDGCGGGSGMVMGGMRLVLTIKRGVGEKSEFGFDTILDNRESRNHPVERITLGF